MESRDKIERDLKKLYVHLQLLGLSGYFKSDKFDLFCEENGLDKIKDKIVSDLHQELGIPIPFTHSLSPSGKIVVDFSNFPEALVKPFLKDLLFEIYRSKKVQFVEIVFSFLTYYSQYNRNLKTWQPTPIDDALIRTIALDLVNIQEDDDDVRTYLKFAGYDSDAILSVLSPKPEIQVEPVFIKKKSAASSIAKKRDGNRKIFIVHGHNEKIKNEVEAFLKSIELEPIILHKQADLGKTIIEKVEHYSDVGFAVILLTKDDLGGEIKSSIFEKFQGTLDQIAAGKIISFNKVDRPLLIDLMNYITEVIRTLKPRPRQNVIFEFGYFIGLLGRKRVAALCEMGVELHSDVNGLLYTPLDPKGEWKKKLGKEINAAGIKIDEKYL
jgi:predicted nucleotide-binding protein